MARVLGIDLGTFNSCVSVMDAGAPVIIANSHGYQTMPSMVAVTESGRRVVGHIAKRQAITNAENTIFAAKRLIGRRFQSTQVQRMKDAVAYRIVEGPHDDPRVVQRGRVLTVPEVSAMILQELKLVAEQYLGEEVERAVVTVPAYFNDNQRQATKDAGTIAGLDVIHIVNEPTAAALAYGFGKQIDRTLAVYDLGGGTFDISILEISSSGVFKVVSTAGDTFLGGEDFDQRLVDWLGVDFEERTGIDVRTDRIAMQRLRDACEKAKCQLSTVSEVEINLPFLISDGQGEAVHLQTMLTRAQLEELTEDLIARTVAICESTLDEAGLDKDEIEDVLLVGGMTRMPAVEAAVTGFFEREPSANVDPDLVVAMGAAVQGAALTEDEHDMVLLDVTPHTLGIVIAGGWMEEIIPQNSTVPIARAKTFTTTRDEQTTVKLMVVQGESRRADENELLGEFALTGLRSARAGEVGLEVSFELDMDGIVSVRAADLETGKEQRIQITASSGLTDDELRGMIEEGRDHAVARRADKKLDEARSQAESLISEIEALRPKVEAAAAGTSFGESAVKNALSMIEKTQQEIERGDAIAVENALEPLRRTLRLFKGASAAG